MTLGDWLFKVTLRQLWLTFGSEQLMIAMKYFCIKLFACDLVCFSGNKSDLTCWEPSGGPQLPLWEVLV
jgi:hypothetical protein